MQVAAELLDGSGDGVWLVELAGVSGEDAVAPAIRDALGIAAQPGLAALETLLNALAIQDVLIVVDNCEHLIGACAKTADAVARRCSRVHLLVTSREPLGIARETIYRVPSLSLPVARDPRFTVAGSCDASLFLDRARAQGSCPAVDEHHGAAGGVDLPPAGRDASGHRAGRRRLRSLSLSDLHYRLDQRFRPLTGGSRTALDGNGPCRPPSSGPIRCSTAPSSCCSPACRPSPRASTWTPPRRSAASRHRASHVAGLLGSPVDKSLVVADLAGPGLRYRLLETIRQFAAGRSPRPAGDEPRPGQRRTARTICPSPRRRPRT